MLKKAKVIDYKGNIHIILDIVKIEIIRNGYEVTVKVKSEVGYKEETITRECLKFNVYMPEDNYDLEITEW